MPLCSRYTRAGWEIFRSEIFCKSVSRLTNFGSEKLFIERLEKLFGENFSAQKKETILKFAEKGVIPLQSSQAGVETREGKSRTLANLNFVQHYNFLKKDHSFQAIGPTIKGNETEFGKPLLPLRTILTFSPGTNFSINF